MSHDPHIILDKELRRDIDAIIQRLKAPTDFRARVQLEKSELDAKLAKLTPFFETSIFANLPSDEQARMRRQSDSMIEYSKVLSERIDAFPPVATDEGKVPDGFRRSRERALAITKLQEAVMWLGMDLKAIGEENPGAAENPYPHSKDPSNTVIDKTADGLRL